MIMMLKNNSLHHGFNNCLLIESFDLLAKVFYFRLKIKITAQKQFFVFA